MEVNCQRCGHDWNYTGERKYRTTCPNCNTTVTLDREDADAE